MMYPLTLFLLSTPVVDALSASELEQQLASVSALRIEELAELTAAAEVRKLQHQLQVAKLERQIADLVPGQAQDSTLAENPLSKLKVLGVIGLDAQVKIWLQDGQQAFFVGLEAPGPNGLRVVANGDGYTLRQGRWLRQLPQVEAW